MHTLGRGVQIHSVWNICFRHTTHALIQHVMRRHATGEARHSPAAPCTHTSHTRDRLRQGQGQSSHAAHTGSLVSSRLACEISDLWRKHVKANETGHIATGTATLCVPCSMMVVTRHPAARRISSPGRGVPGACAHPLARSRRGRFARRCKRTFRGCRGTAAAPSGARSRPTSVPPPFFLSREWGRLPASGSEGGH